MGLYDPRRALELLEERYPVAVGDAGVDRRRADAPVPEMVLDELERAPRVEQVGRDRMPETVAGVVGREAGTVSVVDEERLDLPLAKRAAPTGEERIVSESAGIAEIAPGLVLHRREERTLRPVAALGPSDHDSVTGQVEVMALEERDLADPKSVEIREKEDQSITGTRDRGQERPNLVLGEVLGEVLLECQRRGG